MQCRPSSLCVSKPSRSCWTMRPPIVCLCLCVLLQARAVAKGVLPVRPKVAKKYVGKLVAVGGLYGWTFFMSQMWRPPTVFVGDRLRFSGKGHSVWLFKTKAAFDRCSFKDAVELKPRAVETPFTTPPFTKAGIYYYGCNVLSHCYASGQKLAVRVLPGAFSTPPQCGDSLPTPAPVPATVLSNGTLAHAWLLNLSWIPLGSVLSCLYGASPMLIHESFVLCLAAPR